MTTMELIERGIGHNCLSDAYDIGRADAERDFQNSDYWNDYLAQVKSDVMAEVIDNIKDSIHEIYRCQFYCMADMCEHDSPTVDMCIDCFYDAIQKSLEHSKEKNKLKTKTFNDCEQSYLQSAT